MKTKFIYLLLCLCAFFWSACEKHDEAEGILSPIISLEDVRDIYRGQDVVLNEQNLMGAEKIIGIVISSPESGNVPSNLVVLQNIRRKQIRGICLDLGASAASYHLGDSLVINVRGGMLKKVNGSLQISGIEDSDIEKVSSDNPRTVQVVSSYTIKLRPDIFESTLVRIRSTTLSPAPIAGETFGGDRYLVNGADSITMHTESSANFASTQLPGGATVTGVLFLRESDTIEKQIQVWPRFIADITNQRPPFDPNAPVLGKFPVIITGFVNDAKGSDGNYEYFQFMATETIDFSVTPMSVVTCTNGNSAAPNPGAAPGGGWATGGGRTYKFDLTEGVVNKGDFFYVGGSNKRINGANTTNISSAKWIRSINYGSNDGDGFGTKNGGLLPNSGNAGGIALFAGTNVTETSIPVDAVFFGGDGTTTIVDVANAKGYRVPENDHYNPENAETLEDQPFFYQGSNTYKLPHQNPDNTGVFVKLGGVFNPITKAWVTPRGYVHYLMSATSTLSDIETGGVTVLSEN
ncbi:DUF5689 domain-containing protein [Arcticibacter tournemirensis]